MGIFKAAAMPRKLEKRREKGIPSSWEVLPRAWKENASPAVTGKARHVPCPCSPETCPKEESRGWGREEEGGVLSACPVLSPLPLPT